MSRRNPRKNPYLFGSARAQMQIADLKVGTECYFWSVPTGMRFTNSTFARDATTPYLYIITELLPDARIVVRFKTKPPPRMHRRALVLAHELQTIETTAKLLHARAEASLK